MAASLLQAGGTLPTFKFILFAVFFPSLAEKKKLGPGLDFLLSTPGVHVLT